MNVPHKFTYDQAKAAAIQPRDAVRLLEALRQGDEGIWLQTFADGGPELYSVEKGTSKTGRPWVSKKFCLTGISKPGGKTYQIIRRTELTGSYTLEEIGEDALLQLLNLARCGVFFCVNVLAPDAERRSIDTVKRVAAVFVDLDGAPLPAGGFHLQPTAVVESSAGRFHAYWAVSDLPLEEFTTVQKHLASLYGGDPSVCDLPRVMRLPGYWHGKKGEGFLSRLLELNPEAQYTRADLLGEVL